MQPPTYSPPPFVASPGQTPGEAFAADPFDKRMVDKDLTLTTLGVIVQSYWYMREHIRKVAPDVLKFLEAQE